MFQARKSRPARRRYQKVFSRFHSTSLGRLDAKRIIATIRRRICPWDRAMSLEVDRLTVEVEAQREQNDRLTIEVETLREQNDRLTIQVETLREQLGQQGSP